MAKSKTTPNNHTFSAVNKRQLAALATLVGLMQTASKLSNELDALANNDVGRSLEQIAETAGVPFFDVHNAYVDQIGGTKKARKAPPKARKGRVKA